MRSALLAVFFSLAVIGCWGITIPAGNFRPTPIPLEWHRFAASESRQGRAQVDPEVGTHQASAVVATPKRYWEDALKHSVYLTLVRDNIDALIARGEVISPDQPQDRSLPRDLEDKDLWDKIKSAPFDRVPADEAIPFGDVTLVSSGKLIEADGNYRFSETDKNSPECGDCEIDAKALWSVKRMRHREYDTPGRYQYELTFSVITGPSNHNRKPHENPARTFTVRESSSETINDDPQENRAARKQRGERALWVHKNIFEQDEWEPLPPNLEVESQRKVGGSHGETDRMFTSLFMSGEKPTRVHYYEHEDAQRKYINIRGPPPNHKQKKPQVDHQQKQLTPYPYKPHGPQKGPRPQQIPIPHSLVQHHYLDIDAIGVVSSPYVQQPQDHRYVVAAKPKYPVPVHYPHAQSRPLPPLQQQQQQEPQPHYSWNNVTESIPVHQNVTKVTPRPLEPLVLPTKGMPTTLRIGYVTDHIRPPVYNTPPGVFVTMDKKPFKPLPPMKLHHLPKPSKPIDFRPSPQVLDVQFSEPDPLSQSFRPINVNYTHYNESSTEGHVAESTKNIAKIASKVTTEKSTSSTHEAASSAQEAASSGQEAATTTRAPPSTQAPPRRTSRLTTTTTTTTTTTSTTAEPPPASTFDDIESMDWANLLGAFTGTTPSDVPKTITEKSEHPPSEPVFDTNENSSIASEDKYQITTISSLTTVKPTRPPYKPKPKTVKVKKHKRVTSTTTTKAPKQTVVERPSTEPPFYILSSTQSTERFTAPAPRQVPTAASTTPIQEPEEKVQETPKPKNRYRLSTLMQKGTSVKHDKWSSQATEQKPVIAKTSPVLGKYPSRRTTSNFAGYHPSTAEPEDFGIPLEDRYDDRVIHITTPAPIITSTAEIAAPVHDFHTLESTRTFDENNQEEFIDTDINVSNVSEHTYQKQKLRTKEKLETLFRPKPTNIFSLKTNDRMDTDETTTTQKTVVASPHNKPKNATKCKKKLGKKPTDVKTTEKPTTTEAAPTESITQAATEEVTPDIFEELFGKGSDNVPPSSEPESDKQQDVNDKDDTDSDIFDEFFGTQTDDVKPTLTDELEPPEGRKEKDSQDQDFEYAASAPEDILNESEDTTTPSSNYSSADESKYGDFSEKPYSFFELMAME